MRARLLVCASLLGACVGHPGASGDSHRTDGVADAAAAYDLIYRHEPWPTPMPTSTCAPSAGCGDAGTCWQTVSGGHACVSFAPAPIDPHYGESCDGGRSYSGAPGEDECCLGNADCTRLPHGRCVENGRHACGGARPPEGHHCQYDTCGSDGDCRPGLWCFPRDWSGDSAPQCIYPGVCRTSADCTHGRDGECAITQRSLSCVTGAYFVTTYCRYASDPCRVNDDCPPDPAAINGSLCVPNPDGQGTRCVPIVEQGPGPP